jgi:hypothetical protein
MSDDYKLYTFNESKKKLNEISYILSNKLGERWKAILFLALLLIIAVIVLIIFGINIPNYEVPVGHVKVFFIVSLLSIAFFCAWACLVPYTDTKVRGIVPFPPGTEYIPVDSTQCGISPTLCKGIGDCDTLCKNKDGKNKYGCKMINSPNVYYLGTRLEVGKSYCLPNIKQLNDIEGCGTYTGRIVWAQGNDGTLRWECQCLFPDLYSGSQCLTQVACTDNNPDPLYNKGVLGKLVDQTDGKTEWDPTNMPASLQNVNPYEKMRNGSPRFQCGCDKDPNNRGVYYNTTTDPFVCNKNLCYVGMGSSPDALFDKTTNKCVCKAGSMTSSNISGFCYPFDEGCNPNPITGLCRYGADIYDLSSNRILFKKGNEYYLSDKLGDELRLINITGIVNDTANNIDKNNIFDLSGTIMKDAFYSFLVRDPSDFSDKTTGLVNIIKSVMAQAGKDAMLTRLNTIAKTAAASGKGLAQLCNSFFYKRDAPNCNYQLNKEGAESIFNKNLVDIDCGKDKNGNSIGTAIADITNSKGYVCSCNNQNATLSNGYCVDCVPDGEKTLASLGKSSCCSGKGYIWDAGGTQIRCGSDENPGACFSGNSLVTMGDGTFKRISEVKVGDCVMSGKSKESVNVIAVFTELFEKEKLFGMNGVEPFATTDHCFLTPSHKFSCINTKFVIQKEHKNEKDVVQLEEGTELLMKHLPVVVNNITYQDMTMFNVYNILTEDGSYVVNDFSVSDGFPDIYSHPIVAEGIITILLSVGEELETYDRKHTSELFHRYKHNISFDTDTPPSVENAVSTFFELTQKHENYIKIAYDLWRESFHDFYKLANSI